jgi:hypothetical protein
VTTVAKDVRVELPTLRDSVEVMPNFAPLLHELHCEYMGYAVCSPPSVNSDSYGILHVSTATIAVTSFIVAAFI